MIHQKHSPDNIECTCDICMAGRDIDVLLEVVFKYALYAHNNFDAEGTVEEEATAHSHINNMTDNALQYLADHGLIEPLEEGDTWDAALQEERIYTTRSYNGY